MPLFRTVHWICPAMVSCGWMHRILPPTQPFGWTKVEMSAMHLVVPPWPLMHRMDCQYSGSHQTESFGISHLKLQMFVRFFGYLRVVQHQQMRKTVLCLPTMAGPEPNIFIPTGRPCITAPILMQMSGMERPELTEQLSMVHPQISPPRCRLSP